MRLQMGTKSMVELVPGTSSASGAIINKEGGSSTIGVNHTFKVIFTSLEYNPTMSKRLHYFGSKIFLCTPTSSLSHYPLNG